MNPETVKNSRVLLRRALDHIEDAAQHLGVLRESVGFVDVLSHPEMAIPELNYVTPRRNTAWIGGQAILSGLDLLTSRRRSARFFFVEGLIPAQFADTLTALDLELITAIPILVLEAAQGHQILAPVQPEPGDVQIESPSVRHTPPCLTTWELLARDPAFKITSLHLEPLTANPSLKQVDILLARADQIIGLARLSLNTTLQSGHIVACGVRRDFDTAGVGRLLCSSLLRYAVEQGATMVFGDMPTDASRTALLELGAAELGRTVFYTDPARAELHKDTAADERVAKSVLSLCPTG